MRDILTGLAILLIVAITAAMAVPYFVDWSSYRSEFEARIGQAAGMPVTIDGPIDLKLLPTPSLSVAAAATGIPGTGPVLTVGRARFELAVMPLLRGDIRVIEATLEGPRLEAALRPDGGIQGLTDAIAGLGAASRVSVERLTITGGSAALSDASSGRTLSVSGLDIAADAGALAGPWRALGRAVIGNEPVEVRLTTGSPEPDGTRIKLGLVSDGGSQRAEIDARFVVADGRATLEGRVSASGRVRWPDRDAFAARPWSFSGGLKLAGRSGALEGIELDAGGDEAPVKFTGTGQVELGAAPRLRLALDSKQIDLDRPFTGPIALGQPSPFVPFATIVPGWLQALGGGSGGLVPLLPIDISLTVPNVIAGGDTISGVAVDATLAAGRIQVKSVAATLPGATALQARGDAALADGGRFAGRVTLRTRDAARLFAWAEGEKGGRSARIGDVRELGFDADVSLTSTVFAARSIRMTLDRSQILGTVRYSLPEGGARGRFEAQLTADGLAIDQVPDLSTLTGAARGLDVVLTIDARNVRVGQTTGPNVGAGRVGLRLAVSPDGLQVDTLDITDVGGATVRASGSVGAAGGRLDATIDARRVEPLAELLRKLVPGRLPAMLAARAPTLGPLRLRIVAEKAGADAEARITAEGTAAAARLSGSAAVGGAAGGDKVVGALRVDAPDSAAFLAQLGLEALPLPGFGPGRLAVDLDGRFGQGATVKVSGTAAGVQMAGEGRIGSAAQEPDLAGVLSLDTADIGPLMQILALPGPDALGRLPVQLQARATLAGEHLDLADLSGRFAAEPLAGRLSLDLGRGRLDGALQLDRLALSTVSGLALGRLQAPLPGSLWPGGRFGGVLPPPFETTLRLSARQFDLGAGPPAADASATLRWTAEALEVTQGDMAFAGGRLGGGFSVRRQGGQAAFSMKLVGQGLDVPLVLPNAGIGGRADIELDGASSSETVAGLVGTLSGGGLIRMRGATLARLDTRALSGVTAAFDAERDPPDLARVRASLAAAFDRAALQVAAPEAPLTLSGGILRAGPMTARMGDVELSGSAAVDLRNGRLDARAVVVAEPPPGWSGPAPQATVLWRTNRSGVIERDVDVASLTNVLTTRAVARELERIEAAESDLRERSFFLRRQKSERERLERELREAEEARLAEEARIAEEARKAEEARRAEIARQQEEARRAEQARREEEARRAEQARREEEVRRAEQARREEEARRAEQARREEETRRAEQARQEEEARRAEDARRADEARRVAEEAARLQQVPPALRPQAKPVPEDDQTESVSAGVEEAARLLGLPPPTAGEAATPVAPLPPPTLVRPAPGAGPRQPPLAP